jgi:hypothetical protein
MNEFVDRCKHLMANDPYIVLAKDMVNAGYDDGDITKLFRQAYIPDPITVNVANYARDIIRKQEKQ